MKRATLALVLSSMLWLPMPAAAQSGAAQECARVEAPAARLACYDRVFPPAAGARTLPTEAELREAAQRDFGLNRSQRQAADPDDDARAAPDSIEGVVDRVDNIDTGQRIVHLSNGQIWLLTEATRRGHLKSGDNVRFRKAMLGTYMLLTPSGLGLRAKRVR